MHFSFKKTDRLGRIIIDPDIFKEIFEKINGKFVKEKMEILSIDYNPDKKVFYAECYSENFSKIAIGATIPVIYELYSRKDITPTEGFRRSRKISKIINETQIEKKVIPKKKMFFSLTQIRSELSS